MNRHLQPIRNSVAFPRVPWLTAWFVIASCLFALPNFAAAQNGLERLLKRAELELPVTPPSARRQASRVLPATAVQAIEDGDTARSPVQHSGASLIPHSIQGELPIPAGLNSQDGFKSADMSGFVPRDQATPAMSDVYPVPLAYGKTVYGVPTKRNVQQAPHVPGWNPNAGRDEYVFDGHDRGKKVTVDPSFNVYGLETEDTIGHFDTLDGRRIVTPSNRVAIYAPRFAAVRRVDGVFKAKLNLPVGRIEEKTPLAMAGANDKSVSTKQNLALDRYDGSNRASGFVDRTRGVATGAVTHLFGFRNRFEPYENLSLIRFGRFASAEAARLNLGMQSASVWEDDLGLQVVAKKVSPIIVKDVASVQELMTVKSEDGTAILRVTKVASKIAAKTGEQVEFTIRFDNLSGKRIGNVTIIDNLTGRLDYVADSAECSLEADFIRSPNEAASLMLKWDITEPIEPHTGGIIRFKCLVQ